MSKKILIKNGTVYDPINSVNGEKMDIFIKEGRIVENFNGDADIIYDADGKIVMPGGIDVHTHIVGANETNARYFRPEDNRRSVSPATEILRAESGRCVPNTFATGYRYTKMGYTFLYQPGSPPIKARETQDEMNDVPYVDKTALVLMDKNWFLLRHFIDKDYELAAEYMAWLLWTTKGSGVKVVNPGGTEAWGWGKNVKSLDDPVPHFGISSREIILGLARTNELLDLPHPIHLHLNNLGIPGNYEIAIKTMELLEEISKSSEVARPQVSHITHMQYNSYGGENWKTFQSETEPICKYVNAHDHITIDSGSIVFGDATTLTADGPVEYGLSRMSGLKWTNADNELETGAGVTPFIYERKSLVHSIQWAIGLELYLLITDPWKIMMSTDHPNGGLFVDYPKISAWLMSKKYRDQQMNECHKALADRCVLSSIDREYDLYEIAIITRSACAQTFGFKDKGHLGPGAEADIAVYNLSPQLDYANNPEKIEIGFSSAALTMKSGQIILKDGKIIEPDQNIGKNYWVKAKFNQKDVESRIEEFFQRYYSIKMSNYPVGLDYVRNPIELIGPHQPAM
ncbi:MAG: formylmethanofuran dehydrogenase subunit A [Promethearchaeota archaeon]